MENTKPKLNDSLASAKATLTTLEARAVEAAKPLVKIQAALDAARAYINERKVIEQKIVELQQQRSRLVARKFLDGGNTAELDANTSELQAAEKRLTDVGRLAADAEMALPQIEAQYASAAKGSNAVAAELPGARAAVLIAAGEKLLERYGEKICSAFDDFLVCVALANAINAHARQGGLQQISPELPVPFEFPGITLADFKIKNSIAANQNDMGKARKRLQAWLDELGVKV